MIEDFLRLALLLRIGRIVDVVLRVADLRGDTIGRQVLHGNRLFGKHGQPCRVDLGKAATHEDAVFLAAAIDDFSIGDRSDDITMLVLRRDRAAGSGDDAGLDIVTV